MVHVMFALSWLQYITFAVRLHFCGCMDRVFTGLMSTVELNWLLQRPSNAASS
jgi:hypothetical protein